jgi:hypothetical protein
MEAQMREYLWAKLVPEGEFYAGYDYGRGDIYGNGYGLGYSYGYGFGYGVGFGVGCGDYGGDGKGGPDG